MPWTKPLTIRLNAQDTVAVALADLSPGQPVEDGLVCSEPIPAGHKLALVDLAPQDPIRKYGQIIGFASRPITRGQHVHTHNVEVKDFVRDYAIGAEVRPTEFVPEGERATFQGILREDGRAATRNYIGILPTVSCSAGVARFIARSFPEEVLAAFPNVDGVVALGHSLGCGMALQGEGFEALQRVLAGYAHHPNFAGLLVIGLGCEVNQLDSLIARADLKQGPACQAFNIQDLGGTSRTVERGQTLVREMLAAADRVKRQTLPASHLILALECGGSDAYSGITANPVLGRAVDLLVQNGGTAVLGETTEIYGAEHLLSRRAVSQRVGEKLLERIHWWEDYVAREGAQINNNPTPGNKAGGLTTILEKSLGAAAKGGGTNLVEVYRYAEPITARGFVFMDTPGYDVVSITGMVAGGANVVCFTTGRGTVCGSKPAPTIKLASNSEMYGRLSEDMDVNCGALVDGEVTIEELGQAVFETILRTASGEKTKSERLGFGEDEFVPWQMGAVL